MPQALPILNHRFRQLEDFYGATRQGYTLLPFRFVSLDERRYLISNLAGEYLVLDREQLQRFIRHQLDDVHDDLYLDLKSKHFLVDGDSTVALDLLAAKYRTKMSFIGQFTSLFLFVVTLRCEHSCPYCQVSRRSQDRAAYDMSVQTADRGIEYVFRSPAKSVKVEFQGGEPLLNFELIRHVVQRVQAENAKLPTEDQKDLSFVIATNLALLTDDHLEFCAAHNIYISTSLDGPEQLHNRNRPRPGRDSYQRTTEGIARVRARLGHDHVSALMTTTEASLSMPRQIVEEYVSQGFDSIFLRSISPYGFAVRTGWADQYRMRQWLEFYKLALAHIIELNLQGRRIREEFASILLTKLLTPWPSGYVDLQSPSGLGISVIVFNYDGDIYASDEGRMLAEMGDKTFRLGNLHADSYESVMGSPQLIAILRDTMAEGVPMCADCGFLPYCGSDPVFHHATQRDMIGFKPNSDYCQKNMAVLRHLIALLEEDAAPGEVLRSWLP